MQYRKAGATFCTREWHLQSLQYLAWRARKQRAKKTGFNFTHKQQIMQKVFTTTHHYAKRLGDDFMTNQEKQMYFGFTGDSVHESVASKKERLDKIREDLTASETRPWHTIPTDTVHAPKHYQGDECILAMEKMLGHDEFRGFLRGNIFKYIWRYKDKNGIEDLRKANWYLDRLIKFENF